MNTYAFTIQTASPAAAKKYLELHKNVPLEISGKDGALEVIGLESMEIFIAGESRLFMLVRGKSWFDPKVGFPLANELHPAVQAWDDQMHGELLVRVAENDTELNWFGMKPVFSWRLDQLDDVPTERPCLLDCTLRDGGYQNNWDFSDSFIRHLYTALVQAEADVMELGYLFPDREHPNSQKTVRAAEVIASRYSDADGPDLGVMVDFKTWATLGNEAAMRCLKFISTMSAKISTVRVALSTRESAAKQNRCIEFANILREAGLRVTINIMQIDVLGLKEMHYLIERLQKADNRIIIYLADSFGAMRPDDIRRCVGLFHAVLDNPLGFHAHDNLGLAMVNSFAALEAGAKWIDGTMGGIGRGAGNASTEKLMSLHTRVEQQDSIWSFLTDELEPLRDVARWGHSRIYALCALHNVHPSYGQEIERRFGSDSEDVAQRIQALAGTHRFDSKLLLKKTG